MGGGLQRGGSGWEKLGWSWTGQPPPSLPFPERQGGPATLLGGRNTKVSVGLCEAWSLHTLLRACPTPGSSDHLSDILTPPPLYLGFQGSPQVAARTPLSPPPLPTLQNDRFSSCPKVPHTKAVPDPSPLPPPLWLTSAWFCGVIAHLPPSRLQPHCPSASPLYWAHSHPRAFAPVFPATREHFCSF